jgi:hypothetical protein
MMPPGVPPFPPNGVPPGMGFPPPFPPPPGGNMPPFAPPNLAAPSLQMDQGSNIDNLREGDDTPVAPSIHPDRLRMMGNGTRP